MDFIVQFLFREKLSTARVYIDDSEYPCLIFTILNDVALIREFSDEVTIKSDGEIILPMKYSYPALDELRISMFNSIKNTQQFQDVKVRMRRGSLS